MAKAATAASAPTSHNEHDFDFALCPCTLDPWSKRLKKQTRRMRGLAGVCRRGANSPYLLAAPAVLSECGVFFVICRQTLL